MLCVFSLKKGVWWWSFFLEKDQPRTGHLWGCYSISGSANPGGTSCGAALPTQSYGTRGCPPGTGWARLYFYSWKFLRPNQHFKLKPLGFHGDQSDALGVGGKASPRDGLGVLEHLVTSPLVDVVALVLVLPQLLCFACSVLGLVPISTRSRVRAGSYRFSSRCRCPFVLHSSFVHVCPEQGFGEVLLALQSSANRRAHPIFRERLFCSKLQQRMMESITSNALQTSVAQLLRARISSSRLETLRLMASLEPLIFRSAASVREERFGKFCLCSDILQAPVSVRHCFFSSSRGHSVLTPHRFPLHPSTSPCLPGMVNNRSGTRFTPCALLSGADTV
ncbi:uncharacterized protein LOC128854240 [Cuculus canorus]|uniref:uncharacterized protein LOC128854240 n=1 Tax=Cuculus canorus TaxID=55661 RepID=UPI0023AA4392|nr:uncharacterized protein LOC128854240 [Cuculus canorus]